MARVEVPIVVLNTATGLPVSGASVAITKRSDASAATWWTAETGGASSTAAVITDSSGRVAAWVERGAYNLAVSGTGITSYTEPWDATPGSDATIDTAWLSADVQTAAGLTTATTVRRGKSVISTEQSRTNTAYGLLDTPDRVQNVVLPTDGLICVAYQAMLKNSVAGLDNGCAAIFLGENQVKIAKESQAAPVVAEERGNSSAADLYRPLYSGYPQGLTLWSNSTAYTGDVTTGQLLGEDTTSTGNIVPMPVYIFAAAGTYDVSIRFKAATGTVTVKNRKLWVWTMGF